MTPAQSRRLATLNAAEAALTRRVAAYINRHRLAVLHGTEGPEYGVDVLAMLFEPTKEY